MTRRHIRTFLREATAVIIAVAFLMGLLFLGNCVGQVS